MEDLAGNDVPAVFHTRTPKATAPTACPDDLWIGQVPG